MTRCSFPVLLRVVSPCLVASIAAVAAEAPPAGAGAAGAAPKAEVAKAPVNVPPEPADMERIFNGEDLTGWDGDPRLWSVADGAIRGETTPTVKAPGNTFLIWQGGEVGDFELRLSYRCTTSNNSGIQYRSRRFPSKETDANRWVVGGYQAEVRNEPGLAGFVYDERGSRGRMCLVGEKVTWSAEGKKVVTGSVGDPKAIAATFRTDDWNEYVIICRGNHIRHYLNGVQTIDFTDEDEKNRRLSGIIALQIHGGAPMRVEFKDLRVKRFAPETK